jgi:hypothetical protein
VLADRRARGTSRDKAAVLEQIRAEAKEHGVTLAHEGEGGVPPERALALFRAAKWRCSNPHCPTPKEDLELDHQSGHPKEIFEDPDAWKNPKIRAAATKADGPKDDRFLTIFCEKCHDAVHDRERAIDAGKEPPPMPGR